MQREKFSSRIGFILISAGCAIGLGNVWRFPYITGKYGGGAFVLLYLFFLVILGIPVMTVELAVGRASKRSVALSFEALEPNGSKWHYFKWFAIAGNYLLMMFYTTIAGWMIYYFILMLTNRFAGLSADGVAQVFAGVTGSPLITVGFMIGVVMFSFGICALGLENGVERIVKGMMMLLFALMIVLAVNSLLLPDAMKGLSFYLMPNVDNMMKNGIVNTVFAAMGQAFFTLSIGIGNIAIFGSYINKDKRLLGEAMTISGLDTLIAILSGIVIFPACFAFGVEPNSGPSLIFITLPNVFNHMAFGNIWGALFFLFMSFAALSTVIGVFQNIISFATDLFDVPLKKVCAVNAVAISLLSLPCALGFNVLSGIAPLGVDTTILDLEDFIVSNNILPLGALVYVLFAVTKYGWGFDNFLSETNAGEGSKFPKNSEFYLKWVLPVIVLAVFIGGYLL